MQLDFNPYLNIWIRPRQTIRAIVDQNARYRFLLLSGLYGFVSMMQIAQIFSLGNTFSTLAILIICLILALPVGMVVLSLGSLLVLWLGKLVKGKATYLEVRAALSWTKVPVIVTLVVWLIFTGMFGRDFYMHDFPSNISNVTEYLHLFQGGMFIELAVGIWSLIIFLKALGEVQRFSAWMALLNVVLLMIAVGIIYYFLIWILYTGIQS